MSGMIVRISERFSALLGRLAEEYGHENEGRTIRLALIANEWHSEMRSAGRITGGYLEKTNFLLPFDGDRYRREALFASGEVELTLEVPRETVADLDRIALATDALDTSAMIAESILLLSDMTDALKSQMTIIAIDVLKRSYLQFERKEFEMIRNNISNT